MAAVVKCTQSGTPFCPHCGALLALPDHNPIKCGVCSFSTTFEEVALPVVVTRSAARPTPSWAVENLEARDSAKKQDGPARMTSAERCPKCDHPELQYYTMQTRGADEGQTVFFECPNCNYSFSLNN